MKLQSLLPKTHRRLFLASTTFMLLGAMAVGCTIGEISDNDNKSDGGSSNGGQGGGSAIDGEGGDSGNTKLECGEWSSTSGASAACVSASTDDDCTKCMNTKCCDSGWLDCNSADPATSCRSGTTKLDGTAGSGEFDCILTCLTALGNDYVGDTTQVNDCAAKCGSAECDSTKAGAPAVDSALCLVGVTHNDAGCATECGVLQ